jgi:hypothetical protein
MVPTHGLNILLYVSVIEAIVHDLAVVGIWAKVHIMERAAIQTAQHGLSA